MAARDLRCCAWTLCSCATWASHCGVFSCFGAQSLECSLSSCGIQACCCCCIASLVSDYGSPPGSPVPGILQARRHTGLVAPQWVESSQTRNQTCVPCIGRFLTTGPLGKSFLLIFLMLVQSLVISSFSFLILVNAGVQPRWIQGIRSEDGVGEERLIRLLI